MCQNGLEIVRTRNVWNSSASLGPAVYGNTTGDSCSISTRDCFGILIWIPYTSSNECIIMYSNENWPDSSSSNQSELRNGNYDCHAVTVNIHLSTDTTPRPPQYPIKDRPLTHIKTRNQATSPTTTPKIQQFAKKKPSAATHSPGTNVLSPKNSSWYPCCNQAACVRIHSTRAARPRRGRVCRRDECGR